MVSVIILDLGNVLAFFDRSKTYKRLSEFVPHTPEEIGELIESSGLRRRFELGEMADAEFFLRIMDLFEPPHNVDFELFCRIWGDIFNTNRALLKILSKVNPQTRLVLLSDTNVLHFESIQRNHPEILELFDDRIVLSFREGFAKPDHRIYSKALEVAGGSCDFPDCLYVDDNLENVTAAVQLGMIGHHYVGLYEFVTRLRQLEIIPDLRK